MNKNKIMELAGEQGFSLVAEMDPSGLCFMTEVRDMCASDKCRSYGKSWSCPPACGELSEIAEKCKSYKFGIIVQTIGQMENEFDYEAMLEYSERHSQNFEALTLKLHKLGADMLPMGAGSCRRCGEGECTYPDEACRFPELVFPSMEACGLLVSRVCTDNNIPYYHGKGTITYVSCYLYN